MLARSLSSSLFALALLSSASTAQVLFETDFESSDEGFTEAGFQEDWEWGSPTTGPGAAFSGLRCWGTDLDGDGFGGMLTSPPIDTTGAVGSDGLVLSWMQWLGGEAHAASSYYAYVTVASPTTGAIQTLFGRRTQTTEVDYPEGWRRESVVLGPEFAAPDLEIELQFNGFALDGWYIDDIRIEVLHRTSISVEDFETSDGGFVGEGEWAYGDPFCPAWNGSVPSGTRAWGTGYDDCAYSEDANSSLLSPVLDLSAYANRREAYLIWNRVGYLEFIADAIQHEISYDGGATWSAAAGAHSHASMFTSHVGFGLIVDPAATPSVQLRWRLKTDSSDNDTGMLIDDFEIAVPERVLGTGANPADSLVVSSGAFELGSPVQLAIDDEAASFTPGSIGVLSIALAPNVGLPAGAPIPGWGLTGPSGDYFLDPSTVVLTRFGSLWSPGNPSLVNLTIPNDPLLADLELWLQAVMLDLSGPAPRFGLTNGLFERVD